MQAGGHQRPCVEIDSGGVPTGELSEAGVEGRQSQQEYLLRYTRSRALRSGAEESEVGRSGRGSTWGPSVWEASVQGGSVWQVLVPHVTAQRGPPRNRDSCVRLLWNVPSGAKESPQHLGARPRRAECGITLADASVHVVSMTWEGFLRGPGGPLTGLVQL